MYRHDLSWRKQALRLFLITAVVGSVGWQHANADEHLSEPLRLAEAIALALDNNPELRAFAPILRGLEGQRISADQSPALEVGLEGENLLGSGEFSGGDNSEYTLSLSSVIELGEQRENRVRVAASGYGLEMARQRAEVLTLAGQVTRQFVATLALQEKLGIADRAIDLAQSTFQATARLAEQGAAPEAEVVRARVFLTQSQLEKNRLEAALDSNRLTLATLLGKGAADFTRLEGSLASSSTSQNFADLWRLAEESSLTQLYASEEKLRTAELDLVLSQSRGDISWQVGTRYFQESGEAALSVGVSMPLFSGQRNRGEVQSASAALDELYLRRESALLNLKARLFEAYRTHQHSLVAANALQTEVLPALREALEFTQRAYETGAYSFYEWRLAQEELLDAERDLIDTAASALLNQSFIEQLTAQSLTGSTRTSSEQ